MKRLKVKTPKIPTLIPKTNRVIKSTMLGLLMSNINKIILSQKAVETGKNPITAGKGGKHYGKTSAMGQIAESATKTIRQAKKEHIPYKPMPQMHTLYSLEDMRRL
jgi:hypothetical protein